MDARKIVEVLSATLDANTQQSAQEQLQQVRMATKSEFTEFGIQTHGNCAKYRGALCAKIFSRFLCSMHAALRPAFAPKPASIMTLKIMAFVVLFACASSVQSLRLAI